MQTETDDLELRVRQAFRYRADRLPEVQAPAQPLSPRIITTVRRRPVRAVAIAGVTAFVVVSAAAWWALQSPSSTSRARITAGTDSTTTPLAATPTSLPSAVTGDEVPLTEVATAESGLLVKLLQREQPDNRDFVVVQIPNAAPIVVYHDDTSECMTVAAAPVPAAGSQGACMPQQAATQAILGVLDTGPVELPTTLAYGVWAAVPSGTAYVTTTYGTQTTWQRPIDGISYFALPGARPALGAEPVTMRAYDAQGGQLGVATRSPYQDGAGDWRW